jgi:polyribonucleotide nucleotidyltransferase
MNITKEIEFGGKKLILETGELAKQANLSIKATYGETVILATAVSGGLNPDLDFFPLSVIYEEKLYASGMIKTSRFIKRDGRPTDDAIVTRRLVDHAIRPLFPSDFMDDVQVTLTVLSLDQEADAEVVAMIVASAALHASNIPWGGPMVSAKVGYINDEYVLNPTHEQNNNGTKMEMVVSFVGQEMKFLAIEAELNNLPENVVLGGIEFARENLKDMNKFLDDFASEINPSREKYEYESQDLDPKMIEDISNFAKDRIMEILDLGHKLSKTELSSLKRKLHEDMFAEFEGVYKKTKMEDTLSVIQKKEVQKAILEKNLRPSKRGLDELRPVSAKVGILPRTHGSGIFNRGETQALTVATLGNPSLELLIQDMYGERTKRYIHYYNFPPFSTGETGRYGIPGGREIGHGMLAEKALKAVIPDQKDFPYMILLQSEILSSDGSTSMAATCGSTLALMDAGVPITDMVAGISIGLVADEENNNYVLLTDIQGLEDYFGHMDFKIAGTKDGVTAIQLDMKVKGIPMELLPKIFERSKAARIQILDEMRKAIETPRTELSKYAPKMMTIQIDTDQIGLIIGSGGKTIKEIQSKTGAEIGIDEQGMVFISANDQESANKAFAIIEGMTKELNVGDVYEGEVEEIVDFGAFVEILPGRVGLLHLSEIAYEYVTDVRDHLNVGDKIKVKIIEVGQEGKFSLSIKALQPKPEGYEDTRQQGRHNRNDRRGRSGPRRR